MTIATIGDVRAWRCPDCGAGAARLSREAETILQARPGFEQRVTMAMGLLQGYPYTEEKAVGYHSTIVCENDHEHYEGLTDLKGRG